VIENVFHKPFCQQSYKRCHHAKEETTVSQMVQAFNGIIIVKIIQFTRMQSAPF